MYFSTFFCFSIMVPHVGSCIKCDESHEYTFKSSLDKPPFDYVQLHFEANVDLFGHFFNHYIFLNLDNFDIVFNNFASN